MTSKEDSGHDEYPKGRLDAFTDGVLAIVFTLLVLELKVPGGDESGDLWSALASDWRDYAGYLISFVFVGGVWLTHSTVTSYMQRGDSLTFRLNLLLLFFVSLLPFLTALMTTHLGEDGENLAAALYGVDLFIASALITALVRYVATQPHLIVGGVDRPALEAIDRKRRVLVVILGLSVLIAVVFPNVAVALYFAVSVSFLIAPLVRAKKAQGSRQGSGT